MEPSCYEHFPLFTILPDDKLYFNYRHNRKRLVTEKAFGRLKSRFRILFRKCETVKLYGFACFVLHNLCTERGDLVPRKFNLTSGDASNKRSSPEEVEIILALGITNQKNFEVNKKISNIKSSKSINC